MEVHFREDRSTSTVFLVVAVTGEGDVSSDQPNSWECAAHTLDWLAGGVSLGTNNPASQIFLQQEGLKRLAT
jgi:hypothetical protein